jgi:hypothetical protein
VEAGADDVADFVGEDVVAGAEEAAAEVDGAEDVVEDDDVTGAEDVAGVVEGADEVCVGVEELTLGAGAGLC